MEKIYRGKTSRNALLVVTSKAQITKQLKKKSNF